MYIKKIFVNNFRILKNGSITFDKNFNLIYGKNAQGKTSLIESVYFLATGKSFRTRKLIEQISNGSDRSSVFAIVEKNNFETKYAVNLTKEKRNFLIENENTIYKNYIGEIGIVSFSPEDIELITGVPDQRRRFFNYEMSQLSSESFLTIIDFQKVLKIRNKLLKENKVNSEIFEIYNNKYIELSIKLFILRDKYIKKISKIMNEKYIELFGKNKSIKLTYSSFINSKDKTQKEMEKEFREHLELKKEKEILYGYSLIGPQKDDFIFELEDKIAKSYASQGEKKSILLSLKLAIIENFFNENNINPIFLFDDISAYFDEIRKTKILDYLKDKDIQCFFTSTEKIEIEAKNIKLENGEIIDEYK